VCPREAAETPTRPKRMRGREKPMVTVFCWPLGLSLVHILSGIVENHPAASPENQSRRMRSHFEKGFTLNPHPDGRDRFHSGPSSVSALPGRRSSVIGFPGPTRKWRNRALIQGSCRNCRTRLGGCEPRNRALQSLRMPSRDFSSTVKPAKRLRNHRGNDFPRQKQRMRSLPQRCRNSGWTLFLR
jgi:hypothetical protein